MNKVNIEIGSKNYIVDLAETEEDQQKGLQDITSLSSNVGMLFIFNPPQTVSFWMKDTYIPLDLVFIDDDFTVIAIHHGVPKSEHQITEEDIAFVLEVNQHSGIKIGDELEFAPENKVNLDKMKVLDTNGNTQMELDGGERIFSRLHTKTLIKFAKRAYSTKNDNDYKALGKRVFKFLQVQSETDPEFVESKN